MTRNALAAPRRSRGICQRSFSRGCGPIPLGPARTPRRLPEILRCVRIYRKRDAPKEGAMIDYRAAVRTDRVDGRLYVDPQVFADEMSRIFARGWVFVGHDSEVPEPGDWVTRRIGRQPVILVRDRDGQVHVLANRCAH